MKKDLLFVTNAQKVLDFLLDDPIRDFLEMEVVQATGISKSGINYALCDLVRTGFVSRVKRGKAFLYSLNFKNSVVKQLKVAKTLDQIERLIVGLEPLSSKVVLFGSSSRGEDIPDSDIDLLIISRSKDRVQEKIGRFKSKKKIQAMVFSNVHLLEKKKTDPVFYEQVNRGITVWERGVE